jgi:hypothetical protein
MKVANINVSKIEKKYLHQGAKGKYMDMVLFENRDGRDQYGNDGFVIQGIAKELRDAGERGPIIGNWKENDSQLPAGESSESGASTASPAPSTQDQDDIPF